MSQSDQNSQPVARFGRAGLIATLVLWGVFLTGTMFSGVIPSGFRQLAGLASFVAGIALSVTSLARREPRKLAVITLCLVVAAPLLLAVVAMIVWASYGAGIQ